MAKLHEHSGPSGVGIFFIILIILIIAAVIGWIVFTQLRARRLGLPPPTLSSYIPFRSSSSTAAYPSPAPGGIVGWVNDKFRAFKNRRNRTAAGAYEEPYVGSNDSRRGRRGFGGLDPDEAWDARVGNEADAYGPGGYYEEQELGLRSGTAYGGAGYPPAGIAATPGMAPEGYGQHDAPRGRSRSRDPPYSSTELDQRYNEETGRTRATQESNPFGDAAERSDISLRGVSPRPLDTSAAATAGAGSGLGAARNGGAHGEEDSPTERKSMFREALA
jgi:hypothetical protein